MILQSPWARAAEQTWNLLTRPDDEPLWTPFPGPQTLAYESNANEIFFGGSAGGGKTAAAVGLALTKHRRSLILRRTAVNTVEIVDQLKRFAGPTATWRSLGHGGMLRTADGRVVEVGGCETEDDKEKYSGRPHDGLFFDEAPQFTRSQFRFISAWNRHEDPKQFCRIFLAGNPPTSPEGRWIVEEFAPWLDAEYPDPAKPGELRWFTVLKGKLTWLENGDPFHFEGERIVPKSRTFIPARMTDNPIWEGSDYGSKLQALPEPLRSQLLYGDFTAGQEDDAYQVIPTDWIRKAMARWKPEKPDVPQTAIGVDVARGGRDKTVIACRYCSWFSTLRKFPGSATPDGPAVATLVVQEHRDDSTVNVDVIGVGSSVFDHLKNMEWFKTPVPINNASSTDFRDRSGKLHFTNLRAASYWKMRESLDPSGEEKLALPPDNELLADLCAPRYKLLASGIQVEKKDDIIERIGRSPDCGDAVVMANWSLPRRSASLQILRFGGGKKPTLRLVVCSASERVATDQRALLFTFLDPGQSLPEHGASALLERVVLEFADLDPRDYQSSWQTPIEPYNRLPEDLKMRADQAKKIWAAILKKRAVNAEILIFQDAGNRVGLSAALAIADGLRLKRAETIYRPAVPEWKAGDKDAAPNKYIYDLVLAAKGTVVT